MKEYKKMKRISEHSVLLWLMLIICSINSLNAQKPAAKPNTQAKSAATAKSAKPEPVRVTIQATYFVKNRQIKIRWAPANEVSWRMAMKYGFIIERRTVLRDNNFLTGADQIRSFVSYSAIKDSIKYWEKIAEVNDNAAVMAQAIFGESFEVDLNNAARGAKSGGLGTSLLSKSEENKQRFLFGMYAADNDYPVALLAGLGYTDTATRINEKYFYRIFCAGPKSLIKTDTAMLFVSPNEISELPQSSDITAEPSSKSIVLSWDMERTKSYYTGFIIQRSSDGGKTFRGLTDRPYASLGQTSNPSLPNAVVFTDTAVTEGTNYQYRIAGVSIFGDKGPWSPIASCKSLPLLDGVPGITGLRPSTTGVEVNWYFEDSIRKKITGFEVQHAELTEGPYKTIVKNVSASQSSASLPDTLSTGYLVIKAISQDGISRTSFPYMYQPEDSIPPSSPTGLTGVVDSNGHVVLKWFPNPEKDLLGYKVFRSMSQSDEMAILVDTVWYGTTFNDTLDMRLKNNKIYYSISALDFRHNKSAFSKQVEVIKPDLIPPTPPVFADYKLSDGKVELEWVNSTDTDVKEFFLFRKLTDASKWDTLFRTSQNIAKFTDDKVLPEKKYMYRISVIDEAGHISPETKQLIVFTVPKLERKIIANIETDVDREKRMIYLRWKLAEGISIKTIEIFRGDDKEALSLYKIIDGKLNELLDNELLANTKYRYGIRAMLSNGQYSELVMKEVNY